MSKDLNLHLDNVLKTHNLELNETLMTAYRTERNRIKEAIDQHYRGKIYDPLNSGSCAKSTAINTNFDLDLAIPFTKNSAGRLEDMYADMFSFMEGLKGQNAYPITQVKEQRHSINLLLKVNGVELDIDIVPGRELQEGGYEDNYDLNLYDTKDKAYIKTNIKDHNKLKVWKSKHQVDMKSFLVELLVLQAFDKDSTLADKKLYERLKGSMVFIADNIETIRLADPANAGNVVSATLTLAEKQLIKGRFARLIDDIDKDESKIQTYFPVNQNYAQTIQEQPKFRSYPRTDRPNTYA
jgi:hypothetical protein